ncbi:hypothetical protein FRC06_007310 [Ceratobasidium sp. 370]|nr:hypothetical protein FRC06_007310 [Ceratobasidium sp. 370]
MAEQVDSVSRQRALRSRAPTSQPMPAVGAVPNAGTPGDRQDNGEPGYTDDRAEEPATGTSEPEDGPPTGWDRDDLPNGAAMDVDRHLVGPQAGHVVGGQPHGGGSDFTATQSNRAWVSATTASYRTQWPSGTWKQHAESFASNAASEIQREDDRIFYDPVLSETGAATLGLN